MELKYQSGLEHQQKAIDALTRVFEGVDFGEPGQVYENPAIGIHSEAIGGNIKALQADKAYNVPATARTFTKPEECLNHDIKMETGTGKTYVYTKAIFELHKRYGINKFIVAVPTLAIKEGARAFMGDMDVRRHFRDTCGYNADISLCVATARPAKKGKRQFPSEVREFVGGSCHFTNRIFVLLVNAALISDSKVKMLGRDYDMTVEGFCCPLDAIKATKPVLVIDEPHRFRQTQKTFQVISRCIQPQCIIRFGATFPDKETGKGKSKPVQRDYRNLIYNLNAYESFNKGLVKGVAKEHFESAGRKDEKIRLTSIDSRNSACFLHITKDLQRKFTLRKGDSLGEIAPEMGGMNIESIGRDTVVLSNGQEKHKGEEFDVDIYSTPYQEAMLRLAIKRHFDTERANFNRTQRIKTLALFFIEDIAAFRGDENGENAWLRDTFERLLKEHMEEELENPETLPQEYASYLNASLENLRECSAGYFSRDNSDSDEAVAQEVDDILRNKKQLLQFKNTDGSWNVRRFLFSKWTLKEGWDNPNVFTIVKLRSSGSETSKLQEVGRGLRLPIDEYGNRICNEQFTLNYIVDFKEADFAEKLVAEINGDNLAGEVIVISDEELEKAAALRKTDADKLFDELKDKKYIDRHQVVNLGKLADLNEEYPEFKLPGSGNGNVEDRNRKRKSQIKIRRKNYDELKELWLMLNKKYILFFDKELVGKIENGFCISDEVFSTRKITSLRDEMTTADGKAQKSGGTGMQYELKGKPLPYNIFLKRINKATSLPLRTVHKVVCRYFETRKFRPEFINEASAERFMGEFEDWKAANTAGLVKYKQAKYEPQETSLTCPDGKLRDSIAIGQIGIFSEKGIPSDKYLYDTIAYDSELEHSDIKTTCDEIVVYGKIPRRSISIPTPGGNYSPDFMYVVKRTNGKSDLNIIVEAKGMDSGKDLRGSERMRIDCARKLFEQMGRDGYDVRFETQINSQKMLDIIKRLVEKQDR